MTEHAPKCDRPAPFIRVFAIAGKTYRLTHCPRCGAQSVARTDSKET